MCGKFRIMFNKINWINLILFSMCLNESYGFEVQACHHSSRHVPGVVSIIQEHQYFRHHESSMYWKMSPYYLPQLTNASCSLASATMILNALRSQEIQCSNQSLVTAQQILQNSHPDWKNSVQENGPGVTLDQLGAFLTQLMHVYDLSPFKIEVVHLTHNKSINQFRQALVESGITGQTFILVNFDQKFMSGAQEDAGHFAPVGAYNAAEKRVLIMDPDREYFEPYWVPEQLLLESMQTKDPISDKNRGFITITLGEGMSH